METQMTDIMQLGAGYSDDSPVEALLSAYLAALETLKEEV